MLKHVWAAVLLAVAAAAAPAAVKTEAVTYTHNGTTMKGLLAYDDAVTGKRPGVLVVHEWWGLDDFAKKRAEQLAGLGYVAFACDMYGEGKLARHPSDAGKMAGEVRKNVGTWMGRADAALKVLKGHDRVDGAKLAVIGYCFGGSTALQMAYSNPDVGAAVSFHGGLSVPEADQLKSVKAKILVCHGSADTFIKEETAQKLREAWDKAGVDYRFVYYGGAKHSFTVPDAARHGVEGLAYHEAADRRSWRAMLSVFEEAFGKR
jgi:dienelactone hydrolase